MFIRHCQSLGKLNHTPKFEGEYRSSFPTVSRDTFMVLSAVDFLWARFDQEVGKQYINASSLTQALGRES